MEKIDLNSFIYNERLTLEDILTCITQEEIYSFYSGVSPIVCNQNICSPLREDNVPSFSFYFHRNGSGILMFYDFATKDTGDVVKFVSTLFNISWKDALWKIVYDLIVSTNKEIDIPKNKKIINAKKVIKKPVNIGIKKRKWLKHDAEFWGSFGIIKKTLQKYNVVPISYVFYNKNAQSVDKHAYAYIECKDNSVSYKIYQPFNPRFKWVNNANYSVHQGYRQLPKKGKTLIITKSLKDVMSLRDVMRIPSVGLQSESVSMKDSVMEEYKSRFDKVLCLFDNDKAGKNLSKYFSKRYNVPCFYMPELPNVTDFSDLVKEVGIEDARKIFTQQMI